MELTTKRNFTRLAFFVFILTTLATTESFAQKGRSSSSGVPLVSIGAMVQVGQGKMGNGADVPDRNMIYTPVTAFLGFNIKKLRLGVNYEYNMAGQSVDPAEVNGQNISGKGSAVGARIEYYDGKQSFGLIYRLSDTFTLDKATLQGTTATYKSKGGYQVQYTRQIKKRFGFVIDYTTETFDESLTEKVKWDRIGIGIVLTNFNSK